MAASGSGERGLRDSCCRPLTSLASDQSRSLAEWGIPVPFGPDGVGSAGEEKAAALPFVDGII
uniref:Uncharacterized protein n=1 Tax=Anguilla anguilla TaxID=7936 RepID=A0A0E9RW47_ANGAN